MTDQEIVPTEKLEETATAGLDAAAQARRRLIKAGAIGAPLAISLQSGPAWAAVSYCATNMIAADPPPGGYTEMDDSDALKLIKNSTGLKKSVVLGKSNLPGIVDVPMSAPASFPATGPVGSD